MKKKYLGIRRLFGTKGQHNDEVDLSQEKSASKFRRALIRSIEEKSAHGKEASKSVELSVKRKRVGMRLFGTKGQHNDEVDLSQEKSAHGKETLKKSDLDMRRKETIEVRIKANGDSLVSSVSTTGSHPRRAESKLLSHTEISLSKEEIQKIAKELLAENLVLRKRLWRLRNRGTIPAGIILSSIGAASLLLAFMWNSLILTFIGLGITLWGILIIYISPSRHVRGELLNSISSSMQKCMDKLVTYMGYTGDAIFFHPRNLTGLGQGYVMIPHYAAQIEGNLNAKIDALNLLPYGNDGNMPSLYLHPKGMFLAAPSQGLVDLLEKELGINFAMVDLRHVQEALPRLLIEELKIVDEVSIEENDNGNIAIKFTGGPCTDLCKFVSEQTKLGNHLGCPLCSAVALVVSKVRGKPVSIQETKITDDNMISTTYVVLNP